LNARGKGLRHVRAPVRNGCALHSGRADWSVRALLALGCWRIARGVSRGMLAIRADMSEPGATRDDQQQRARSAARRTRSLCRAGSSIAPSSIWASSPSATLRAAGPGEVHRRTGVTTAPFPWVPTFIFLADDKNHRNSSSLVLDVAERAWWPRGLLRPVRVPSSPIEKWSAPPDNSAAIVGEVCYLRRRI
jgi:hypothetical protein